MRISVARWRMLRWSIRSVASGFEQCWAKSRGDSAANLLQQKAALPQPPQVQRSVVALRRGDVVQQCIAAKLGRNHGKSIEHNPKKSRIQFHPTIGRTDVHASIGIVISTFGSSDRSFRFALK